MPTCPLLGRRDLSSIERKELIKQCCEDPCDCILMDQITAVCTGEIQMAEPLNFNPTFYKKSKD